MDLRISLSLESYKNKKDLVDELNYYRSIILKKVKSGEYHSALEKVRSALVLLEEHQENFDIEKEIIDFSNIKKQVISELSNHRIIYERRFNNLLKEKINESNLENFTKLLAMLENDVEHNLDKYHLNDISININRYFKFIKKIYEILSCYKVLNYHNACREIFEFVRDIKSENFPNLKILISQIYQDLIRIKLFEFSKKYNKISLPILSKKMDINQKQLLLFIDHIKEQPKSPVRDLNYRTQEIIFRPW